MAAVDADALREIALLDGLTERDLMFLADCLVAASFADGEVVMGDAHADALWLVTSGEAAAAKDDSPHYSDVFATGDHFGELSLAQRPSPHCVRARGDLRLLKLDREHIKEMPATSAKRVLAKLTSAKPAQLARYDRAVGRAQTKGLLAVCSLLDTLTSTELDQLADNVERVELQEGEVLLEQGVEGDEVYFVEVGQLGGGANPIGPRVAVAEDALLRSVVHAEALAAIGGPAVCVKLSRGTFEKAVGGDCESVLKRDPVAYNRRLLKQSFDSFDVDGSGTVDKEEVAQAMAQQGVEMTSEELDELFATVDDDGSGEIDFEEFILCVAFSSSFC